MVNRLKPLNLVDFTGGVNLRPETFQLAENELPELLNLEVDPRGGLNTRKSWGYANSTLAVSAGTTWNPRRVVAMRKQNGDRWTYLANAGDTSIRALGPAGTYTSVATDCASDPHMADFASWGDLMYAVKGTASMYLDGATATALTACAAANWQNDYTAPGATDTFPIADFVATHMGYMFTARTTEDAVKYPNRIRWSHPNNPRRWAQSDYIDIKEGAGRITAIVPWSDRLLIFKPDSVWALFGYDADTWDVANISRTVGAVSRQTVCRNEAAVFFMSWPQGIFFYNGTKVDELSVQVRPVFADNKMDPAYITNSWVAWVDRRLWCSLPYNTIPAPTDAQTVFVWDPTMECWTMFRGGDANVPGPFVELPDGDRFVAYTRKQRYLIRVNGGSSAATDEVVPGTVVPFDTRFRTKWVDAGAPTWRKSWRRPDFLLRGLTLDTAVNVQVFHDFDNFNAERSFQVLYTPDNYPAIWTVDADPVKHGFRWGDGTNFGGSDQTSSVERGGTMGRAGTVQLLCVGNPGVTWGLNGIIFKFVPRRFR